MREREEIFEGCGCLDLSLYCIQQIGEGKKSKK
jgi:hypothetical protein